MQEGHSSREGLFALASQERAEQARKETEEEWRQLDSSVLHQLGVISGAANSKRKFADVSCSGHETAKVVLHWRRIWDPRNRGRECLSRLQDHHTWNFLNAQREGVLSGGGQASLHQDRKCGTAHVTLQLSASTHRTRCQPVLSSGHQLRSSAVDNVISCAIRSPNVHLSTPVQAIYPSFEHGVVEPEDLRAPRVAHGR